MNTIGVMVGSALFDLESKEIETDLDGGGDIQVVPSLAAINVSDAAGIKLSTTVIPLILRGVNLLGINSVHCPIEKRVVAWNRLSELISHDEFEEVTQEITLDNIDKAANDILAGQIRGRTVINTAPELKGDYQEIFKGY